jgi:2-furoyl-CoA dehydrogenase 2Fe-2S iron sulfur subunit
MNSSSNNRQKSGPEWLTRHATCQVVVELNGQNRCGQASARTLLSDYLRHELGATGTHVGCEHGVCGACTVLIDGVAQRTCLTLAVQCEGRSIQTVEAQDPLLDELRAAFTRHHALQCGFCTSGILMSCVDWIRRLRTQGQAADETAVREMLSGHLCRCTGYTPIVQAVMEVANA